MGEGSKEGNNAQWTIIVASGEGDTANIRLNANQHLHQLLKKGLKSLFGEPAPEDQLYDVVINGVPQDDLTKTLTEAGLTDGAEVVILPKDVSRG